MDDITEEIVKKAENLEIKEAEFGKWNEFPPEIKLECIKNLDVKTRWNLRNTSKTERSLVNSQKFDIKEMMLWFLGYDKLYFDLREDNNSQDRRRIVNIKKFITFIKFVIENSVFEAIEFSGSVDELIDLFPETEFISVKKMIFNSESVEQQLLFWIGKSNDKLESIEIEYDTPIDFDQILSQKKIRDVHFLQFIGTSTENIVSKLAKIWIDNDAEIGKKFQGHLIGSEDFAEFKEFGETFSDRIISKTDRMIRIRTNDEEKHTLLELGKSTFGKLDGTEEFLRMTVIPSKMKESEYDTSGEWIRILAEREKNKQLSLTSSQISAAADDFIADINERLFDEGHNVLEYSIWDDPFF